MAKTKCSRCGGNKVILQVPSEPHDITTVACPECQGTWYNIIWSPEGRTIATVFAKTAVAAKRLTPKPYNKFKGEVYVETVTETKKRLEKCKYWMGEGPCPKCGN